MQIRTFGMVTVLDDTYNANADSMRAALDTLKELACSGRRIAVLGEMCELGQHSAALHAEVGKYAAELGICHVFAVGRWARVYGESIRAGGGTEVHEFEDKETAANVLRNFVRDGDLVLVKASRAMGLEYIVEALGSAFTSRGKEGTPRTHSSGKRDGSVSEHSRNTSRRSMS